MPQWLTMARPERAVVIKEMTQKLGFDQQTSWIDNIQNWQPEDEVEAAYVERLRMELINVAAEKVIQAQANQLKTMQQLMDCENQVPGQASLISQQNKQANTNML